VEEGDDDREEDDWDGNVESERDCRDFGDVEAGLEAAVEEEVVVGSVA